MKNVELKRKSRGELKELLAEKKARFGELRFLLLQRKTKNVKEASWLKRDVARILTILNSKT